MRATLRTVIAAALLGGCGDASSPLPSSPPPSASPAAAREQPPPAGRTEAAPSAQSPPPATQDTPRNTPEPPSPPAAAAAAPWLDPRGTSIVGFGILRVVPPAGRTATFRLRYREVPDGYATTGNLQMFVLPADAFATADRAYAGDFLAFVRTADAATTGADGSLHVEASFSADRERTLLVAYGPWTAPDAGRPAGDVPTFSVDVSSDDGAFEWVESEAGELITTNWTNRPEVARGAPCRDARSGGDVWIEVRPMILYDGRLVRAAGEPPAAEAALPAGSPTPAALRAEADRLEREGRGSLAADRRDRAADLEAHLARADRRLVLTRDLAEKFRRVPIRWR